MLTKKDRFLHDCDSLLEEMNAARRTAEHHGHLLEYECKAIEKLSKKLFDKIKFYQLMLDEFHSDDDNEI